MRVRFCDVVVLYNDFRRAYIGMYRHVNGVSLRRHRACEGGCQNLILANVRVGVHHRLLFMAPPPYLLRMYGWVIGKVPGRFWGVVSHV